MPNSIRLNIAEACHENWHSMTPAEQGRYCSSCQKTVTDFTSMTDREIITHMTASGSNSCGRFTSGQLNRAIALTPGKRHFNWAYAWNLIVATALLTFNATGQTKPATGKTSMQKRVPKGKALQQGSTDDAQVNVVRGMVVDKTSGQPIPFATIRIKGTVISVVADSLGRYSITANTHKDASVEISAVGYGKQEYKIGEEDDQLISYMERNDAMMEDVVIKGYGAERRVTMVGGFTSIRSYSIPHKIKRAWQDSLPSQYIRAYPNPVIHGQSLTLELSLKRTGSYILQLLTTDGKVIHTEPVNVQNKKQLLTLPINSNWGKGVFWLYVNNRSSGNEYQKKIIIQ